MNIYPFQMPCYLARYLPQILLAPGRIATAFFHILTDMEVYFMKYGNLDELLSNDKHANKYFLTLPGYVQEMIRQRSRGVNSFESLKHYVENLTKGDC